MMQSSRSTPDMSALTRPIELGSPTVIQLLNARTTSTKEVVECLERECEAILECRQCRSLFRSLANFIAHKRVYCQGVSMSQTDISQYYPAAPAATVTVNPTDPDTDQLSLSHSSKQSTNARKTIAPNKKSRQAAVRRTAPSDLSKITNNLPEIKLTAIEGVKVAVTQSLGPDIDGRTSAAPSNNSEQLVTVQPKDGYPNMNLRQRGSKTNVNVDQSDDWEDVDEYDDYESRQARYKQPMSRAAIADALSRRTDCNLDKLLCLLCTTTFATAKSLNFHMLTKHIKQRKFYPCIYCKNVFTQFWGVTRHLKRAHGLTGDSIEKIREKIRARVYTDPKSKGGEGGGSIANKKEPTPPLTSSSTHKSQSKKRNKDVMAAATARHGQCGMCHKVFAKRQYLNQHMIACYKKAGEEPPAFTKQAQHDVDVSPTDSAAPHSNTDSKQGGGASGGGGGASGGGATSGGGNTKPLLFVCKTCNRAFSMRQNMMQHAAACIKRHKGSKSNTSVVWGESEEASSRTSTPELLTQTENQKKRRVTSAAGAESSRLGGSDTAMTVEDKDIDDTVLREGKEMKTSPHYDADDILFQLSPSDEAKEEELSQTPPATPTSLAQSRPKRNVKPKRFYDGERVKVPEVVKIQQADGSLVYKLREDVENPSNVKQGKKKADLVDSNGDCGLINPEADSPSEDNADEDADEEETTPLLNNKSATEEKVETTRSAATVSKSTTTTTKSTISKSTPAAAGNKSDTVSIEIGGESLSLLDSEDETKLAQMTDMKKLICLRCKRQYGSSSSLRRHAIRHLGWRRYKCKLCKYSSYNKSECKGHLRKSHSRDVSTLLDSGLTPYIIDLSSLLDESVDEGMTGRTILHTATDNSASGTKSSTAADQKRDAGPTVSSSDRNRKARGRKPRKQDLKGTTPSTSPPVKIAPASVAPNSTKSGATSSANSTPTRTRGRPRKQELVTKCEAKPELVNQDENNKRSRGKSNSEVRNAPPPAKIAKISTTNSEAGTAKPPPPELRKIVDGTKTTKISSEKLEGLMSKLKTVVRKPLTAGAAEDNSTVENGANTPSVVASAEAKFDENKKEGAVQVPATVLEVSDD